VNLLSGRHIKVDLNRTNASDLLNSSTRSDYLAAYAYNITDLIDILQSCNIYINIVSFFELILHCVLQWQNDIPCN